jgi:hypothetical protein
MVELDLVYRENLVRWIQKRPVELLGSTDLDLIKFIQLNNYLLVA